tara:strand:- start:588 stop:902 length:315 start_codon:yes stop_codon:yes gene_type:complete
VNVHLKKYILSVKSDAIRLGFRLRIDETNIDTVVLASNAESNKVGIALIQPDIFGDVKIKSFMINQKKYNWARDEGFSIDQMIELTQEGIFVEIDPKKLANYLL